MISKEVTVNGITTDEAIENGCEQLGVSRDKVKYEIIELPKQKTLGLFGGSPAVVRVYIESDPAQEAKEYLGSIVEAMGLDGIEIEIKYNEDGSGAELDLTGDGLGNVIGRHGETLAALQYLVSLSANSAGEDYYRITINIGNYREKHESSLENLAKKTAIRSLKMNTNLALEYMNPYERRIVHTAVQEIEGATSWSVGEGTSRHVVIGPEGLNEGEDGLPVNRSRGYGRSYGGRSYGGRSYSRSGYRNNRRYQNNRYRSYGGGGYHGGNRYYSDSQNNGEQNNNGYARQGRYAGNHSYSTGYDRYDNNNSQYRNGYYNKGGYGGNREETGEDGFDNGYRRNNSYRGGGYNRGNGARRNYSRTSESSVQNETREIRKDSSVPLYGRIEVKKPETDNGDE